MCVKKKKAGKTGKQRLVIYMRWPESNSPAKA